MSIVVVLAVLFGVGFAIKKNYNTQVILLLAGSFMFLFAYFTSVGTVELKDANIFFYLMDKVRSIFSGRFAELGLIIMSSAGFASYMKHIGAVDALVKISLKPLSLFKNPYVLGAMLTIIGNILQMFITSAAGLGILLMSIAYPIMRRAGLGAKSAAAFVIMTGASEFGPAQTNAIFAAEQAGMNIIQYVVEYQVYGVWLGLPLAMLVAIFWFKFLDSRDPTASEGEYLEEKTIETTAPIWYALFPVIPVILLITFSKYTGSSYNIHIVTAVLVSVFVPMVIDAIRQMKFREVIDGYDKFLAGMSGLVPIVGLLVAAQFFAEGLLATNAVKIMLDSMKEAGMGGVWAMGALVGLILATALITGSGNASFLSLGHLAPQISQHLGVPAVALIMPMQITASVGRAMSPIAGVVIAVAGIAKVSPFELVKRSSVPLLTYIIIVSIVGFSFF